MILYRKIILFLDKNIMLPSSAYPPYCMMYMCYFVAGINKLCVSVKSQRSVKHIWFLPTPIANPEKPKELALSHRS